MIAEIGHYALVLALGLALIQSVVPILGARLHDDTLMGLAGPTALALRSHPVLPPRGADGRRIGVGGHRSVRADPPRQPRIRCTSSHFPSSCSLLTKARVNAAYFGGRDLDRYSTHQFGLFDDTRIHGVPSAGVRYDELARNFDLGPVYIFDVTGDLHASLNAYIKIGVGPVVVFEDEYDFVTGIS